MSYINDLKKERDNIDKKLKAYEEFENTKDIILNNLRERFKGTLVKKVKVKGDNFIFVLYPNNDEMKLNVSNYIGGNVEDKIYNSIKEKLDILLVKKQLNEIVCDIEGGYGDLVDYYDGLFTFYIRTVKFIVTYDETFKIYVNHNFIVDKMAIEDEHGRGNEYINLLVGDFESLDDVKDFINSLLDGKELNLIFKVFEWYDK